MSETCADAQFDMLEAAYDEVPIEAKARIAELERRLEALQVVDWWTDEHGDTHAIAANGQEVCHYVRGEHAEAVSRALAERDALIWDMWKCLSAHIESAINDGGIGYDYKPQERGCGESCTVNGEDCSMSLIERRMRELGIEA